MWPGKGEIPFGILSSRFTLFPFRGFCNPQGLITEKFDCILYVPILYVKKNNGTGPAGLEEHRPFGAIRGAFHSRIASLEAFDSCLKGAQLPILKGAQPPLLESALGGRSSSHAFSVTLLLSLWRIEQSGEFSLEG